MGTSIANLLDNVKAHSVDKVVSAAKGVPSIFWAGIICGAAGITVLEAIAIIIIMY